MLKKSLDEVVSVVQPKAAADWTLVKIESERLLKVWCASEGVKNDGAIAVSTQILSFLTELSTVAPTLVVSDKSASDQIAHISDYRDSVDSDDEIATPPRVVVWKDEEEEEEEEVKEEEEEEEVEVEEEVEEEGMEVEQVFIRGRAYWLESGTNKLYANAAGDELGDEVGVMVNGKPRFLN